MIIQIHSALAEVEESYPGAHLDVLSVCQEDAATPDGDGTPWEILQVGGEEPCSEHGDDHNEGEGSATGSVDED